MTAPNSSAGHRYRVLIAGLHHETHMFLDGNTSWKDFEILEGNELLPRRGDASPLGGVLEYAHENEWTILPTIWMSAMPSAIVDQSVFEEFWDRFRVRTEAALAEGIDAIYLVLHGAFVTTQCPDVEGEWLRRIRIIPGCASIPIFGVYDPHANFSCAMAGFSNCLIAYRENPHWDARESAIRAAALLNRALRESVLPKQYCKHAPVVWPPTGVGSSEQPIRRLLEIARAREEQHEEIWAVNVTAGYSYSDTFETGVCFSVVTSGSEVMAIQLLSELVANTIKHAPEGNFVEQDMDELLTEWKRLFESGEAAGLTVIAEPSDNIGGGSPGDGTGLLRGLLMHEIQNAGICLWDPISVSQLQFQPIGDTVTLQLGGRGSRLDAGPVELDCQLLGRYEGLFELEDKQSHLACECGDRFDMGQCAVVEHRGITILLTSNSTPPTDLGQWRHVGVAPESFSLIGVKAAVSHRRAYDPIAARQYWVATPGPCQSDLRSLPYRNIRRPIYPLDPLV